MTPDTPKNRGHKPPILGSWERGKMAILYSKV